MFRKLIGNRHAIERCFIMLFWLVLASGFFLKVIFSVTELVPQGDEGFFLKELARFEHEGLRETFSAGVSHLHVTMVFLLSRVVKGPLLAGRILSLIMLLIATYVGARMVRNLGVSGAASRLAIATLAYLLVFSQAGKIFFYYGNDTLMIMLAMLSTYLLQLYGQNDKAKYLLLAGICGGMMFWVRSFSLLIIVGMALALVLQIALRQPRIKHTLALVLFVFVVASTATVVQLPSIMDHGKLSFESKNGRGDWSERNWVTRWKRENIQSFFSYRRVSWDEVEEYKQKYGHNSIPQGALEILSRDPKFFVDNFAANLLIRVPFVFLSGIGFLFLLFLDFLRRPLSQYREGNLLFRTLMLSVFLCLTLGLSIVIINYIEHRWLLMALISALMLGSMHIDTPRLDRWRSSLVGAQWLFLLVFSLAGLGRAYQVLV